MRQIGATLNVRAMSYRISTQDRSDIKESLAKAEKLWNSLYPSFMGAIILAIVGIQFCLSPRPAGLVIGGAFFLLSALFVALYRWSFRQLLRHTQHTEWLPVRDQLVIALLLGLALVAYSVVGELGVLLFVSLGFVYGTWREKPFRRHILWRTARAHLRGTHGAH